MTFEKITENVENISLLPDNPILSPAELKAEFDKGNKIIKEKFNKLIDDLNNEGVGDTFPIGAITEYPVSESVPNNWLLCNGQAVSRIEYEELFEILGTTWGTGDGSTTFNLPNRAGLIAIGAGTHTDTNGDSKTFVLGQEYGEYNHTLTTQEMPSHDHNISIVGIGSGSYGYNVSSLSIGSSQNEKTGTKGGGQSHNNIQPSQATNFIIKARQSAGVSASVIQEDGTPNETDVYSSEATKELIKTKYILATISSSQAVSPSYTIQLNQSIYNNSNMTIENGKVKIGSGISKVKVSGAIFLDNWTNPGSSDYLWGIIKKNNSNLSGQIITSSASFISASIQTTIEAVNEGDYISLVADSTGGGRARGGRDVTFLLVEVIE